MMSSRCTAQIIRFGVLLISVFFMMLGINKVGAQTAGYDWLQWGGDSQHSGNNTYETRLNIGNVKQLHRLFTVTLPAVVDSPPVYLRGAKTASGTKDLLFMTTKPGHLVAVDARTGAQVWIADHTVSNCLVNNGNTPKDVPQIPCWTTSAPAIDPNKQYVYSYGLDGYIHKHQVGDGTEIKEDGWPEQITLKPWTDKSSSGLTLVTAKNGISYLYANSSGYPMPDPGDWGDYQGRVTAINLTDGTQKVFNALCSNLTVHFVEAPQQPSCPETKAGIWGHGGVVYSPETDRIYATTGNGRFDPAHYFWGDSVLALNPDGTGRGDGYPLDSYTPTDFQVLQDEDRDLASQALMILPPVPNSKIKYLAVQGGKDGTLRLLNLDDLSGKGRPGEIDGELDMQNLPYQAEITLPTSQWVNPADKSPWIFAPTYFGVSAWQVTVNPAGTPKLVMKWKNDKPCTSIIVANNVLYCAAFKNIWAFNPLTGEWIWGEYPIGNIHWESPIVVNGVLYITDESGELIAYSI